MSSIIDRKGKFYLSFYMIPIVLFYLFVVLAPVINSIWHSLHVSVDFKQKFVGMQNYVELIQDKAFWLSLWNNFFIIGASLIFKTSAGFIIAAMMRTKFVVCRRFIRAVLFFPVVLSPVVIGLIWVIIYDYENGLLNYILDLFGIEGKLWLSDPSLVMKAVTAPLIWQYIGFYFVIFASGLAKIDEDILHSASIDGAGFWKMLFFITLPLMVSTWRVALILAISGGLKVFEQIFVMTDGGPGFASTVAAQFAYNQGVMNVRFNYSSTAAMAIVLISLIFMGLVYAFTNKFLKKYE